MKRILLLLFSLITTAAIGQYPINQILSSDSTMVSVGRNATGGIRGGLVNMVFADTTAANLSRISYYTGAQIWTTTDSAIWVRFKGTPSFWVKMAGASGGTTGSFWNITGNYFGGGVPLNYGVGTNSYDYLPLKTNNITRLLIPPDGILRSSAPANKYLMMDTTTLEMYYGDGGGGGGGSGWLLTGNSGTTSSNFIGTTDNQPLSFRVNNRWAGRIYTNGSVFIGDSSGVNNSALNNAGFGRYSLYNNTTGEGNTGSGAYSLYSNIDGELNTGSGLNSLYNNTTGWGNTGSGVYSLYSNTSGEGNTGSGVYSLYSNIDGSNNTGMGYTAGYNAKQKVDAKNQILIGANTYGTRDSIAVIGASFMKETIVRGKLIDSTLSAGAGTKAVRWNSSTGEFTYADTSEVTTPTWQQTLTAGSTLTVDNNINAGGNTFSLTNQYGMYIESTNGRSIVFDDEDGEPDEISIFQNVTGYNNSQIQLYDGTVNIRNLKDLRENEIFVTADSIWLRPSLGQLNIDSLRTWSGISDTTYKKPMTWDTRNGRWEYAANWPQQKINLVFGAGSGADADTTAFTTSAIYGSFYNDADTIVVTSMRSVLQGTSPDVTYKVWYNDSLNVEAGATALVTAGSQVTNTTTGTNVTSFDATKIPPGVWVWVKTSAVTTKPTYFSLTINANR